MDTSTARLYALFDRADMWIRRGWATHGDWTDWFDMAGMLAYPPPQTGAFLLREFGKTLRDEDDRDKEISISLTVMEALINARNRFANG